MNWQTFSTTGFLVHKQSGIKLYLYGINPKSLKSNLPQLSEFIKKIKPTVTGLHMGHKLIIPDKIAHEFYIDSYHKEKETIFADSFEDALREQREESSPDDFQHTHLLIDMLGKHDTIIKILDIPDKEYTPAASEKSIELLDNVRKRFRLKFPFYSTSFIGSFIYRYTIEYMFGNINQRLYNDNVNVDEWRSLLRLWGGFHQDAYFNLLHLPNAVMLEKSRSIIRALFYTHPFYTRSEEDNTRSISQRKSEDIDKSRVNSEPPCILLIVGKPNTFGMIKLFKQHLQYAHFPAQSSTSKSYSHLVLKDSIKSVKESEAGMLENELYKGETKQGIDVCQMSSRDFMFSKHVPDFDVVYGPFERRPEDYIKIDSTFKKEFKYIE